MLKSEFFDKNIKALKAVDVELSKKLSKIKETKKFDLIFNKDPLDLNIIELKTREKIYQNPLKELEEKITFINENKALNPVLFFYGIGNGFLYKALLQNQIYKKIIVFEKDLELIFLAFNLSNFSEDLASGRLIIVLNKDMNPIKALQLFTSNVFALLYRSYFLELCCDYYEKQKKDILTINRLNKNAIIELSLKNGNDPGDALQGIDQFIQHLPKMLTHPSIDSLMQKRQNKADTAIIVATGPSLNKQLPLLKKYAKRASIFCLDASYAILAKENIKPDYVLSLERVEATSKFFDNDFKEFDKDVLFILLALTHPKTLNFIEKNHREYMLAPKMLPLAQELKFKEFGFLNGWSVAHMAYSIAWALGHKNIILIGQDLAYAKDGTTHSKNYPRGLDTAKREISTLEQTELKAYGGKGKVKSTKIWSIFKDFYEQLIYLSRNSCKTYNATEGGARIEGAIEKPFKELCESLLTKDLKKPLPKPKALPRARQNELMLQSYKKLKGFIKSSENLGKDCKKLSNQIKTITKGDTQKHSLESICQNIETFKSKIGQKRYYYLSEILGPSTFHSESLLSPLYLSSVKNDSDRQNKLVAWIYANEAWIDEIYNLIFMQNGVIKRAIVPLRETLEKRKVL
ncbi:motility associated factor glycosyltransferase family protein [Campylobacter upsaliensis]|nr:motility associated factor glycosyltransferase family protein [Campylobacter upsaliensis]EKM1539944.1 motility associated factor glycosyltransferase family protein [Campylobacter upsaliensis]HEF3536420.1 motility associated factor glycosyltransferase family protein [Campylobacter upsaliensis]HEF3544987.1 motility associated factor glycosyltransferase family protein [Campylobacter upsaliensis]HEF3559298.1 motility associated factor glycosyltransferase family protein [Campylobacter upsaliensis